jgi:hypothetical protein
MKIIGLALAALLASAAIINAQTATVEIARILPPKNRSSPALRLLVIQDYFRPSTRIRNSIGRYTMLAFSNCRAAILDLARTNRSAQ